MPLEYIEGAEEPDRYMAQGKIEHNFFKREKYNRRTQFHIALTEVSGTKATSL
jgi:hypothetical protein